MNITLLDAIGRMEPGDTFKTREVHYGDLVMKENKTLGNGSDDIVSLSAENLNIEGKIIKVRKEPVSAVEYTGELSRELSSLKLELQLFHIDSAYEAGEQNIIDLYSDLLNEAGRIIEKSDSELGTVFIDLELAFARIKQYTE